MGADLQAGLQMHDLVCCEFQVSYEIAGPRLSKPRIQDNPGQRQVAKEKGSSILWIRNTYSSCAPPVSAFRAERRHGKERREHHQRPPGHRIRRARNLTFGSFHFLCTWAGSNLRDKATQDSGAEWLSLGPKPDDGSHDTENKDEDGRTFTL